MSRISEVRTQVMELLPKLAGWKTYTGGVATGKTPPWIVVSFSESGRAFSEAHSQAMSHTGALTVRVVGTTEMTVNEACEQYIEVLDGSRTTDPGISILLADTDSGTYLSDLVNPVTSLPFVMRVLSWQLSWTN